MKSVQNFISYLHEFFWNFSQFPAIYFERFSSREILIQKMLTSGSHLSDAAVRAGPAWQRAVSAWLPCTAPLQCLKYAVGTARRRPDSAHSDRLSENRRRAADAASPHRPDSAHPDRPIARFEADHHCPSAPTVVVRPPPPSQARPR
jgi:hypothetical protein